MNRPNRRRPSFPAAVAAAAFGCCLAGCDGSVAPAPTGQLDGGGAGGGYNAGQYASDVPRGSNPAPAPVGDSGKPAAAHSPSAAKAGGPSAGIGTDFYAAAAEAAPKGPAGPAVAVDGRPDDAVAKAMNAYPPLVALDRSAAEALPAPDPAAAYVPIVDPADGELPADAGPLTLPEGDGALDGVRFSSPAAGQVVLLTRVTDAGKPDRSRLTRYDLASGKATSRADLPDRAVLLDVSPDGTRALVRLTAGLAPQSRPASSQTRLDVWELVDADGRHVVGWRPGDGADAAAVPVGGVFLDGDRVVTLTDRGALTLWNFVDSEATYTIETGGRGPLIATPGRKFVALFTGKTFGAFEADTGAFRGLLAPPRETLAACPEAAFSPDGARLAALLRRPAQSIAVWDVKTGRPAHEADAPIGLGPGLHFGSAGYVVAGGTLFDLAAEKPVWLYAENSESRNVPVSPDLRHWVVTRPAFSPPVLQATDAPIDAVASAARGAASLAPPRLGPGDAVAVRLKLADFAGDRAAFEAALGRDLARVLGERGLRLDPEAPFALSIDADERATGETISFSSVGIGVDEAVPAHEIALTLAVVDEKDKGKTLWADSGRVSATTLLTRQQGKSLEAVLLDELWRSAPAAIAAEVERAMPPYLRTTSAESVLGQTRLWAGPDDVSLPGQASLAANDAARGPADAEDAADDAPARQPATTLTAAPAGAVVDLLALSSPPTVVTVGDDRFLRFWEANRLTRLDEVKQKAAVTRLASHPAAAGQFAFGTEEGQVRLFDAGRRNAAAAYEGANGPVTAVAVTAEPTVVAGTAAGRVVRWTDEDRGKPILVAEGPAAVTGLAAVPYQNRVVAAWADGTAKLLDVGTGEAVHAFEVAAGPIHDVAVAPDARTAALATETGGAVLVSLQTGAEEDRLDSNAVTALAYRPEGTQLVTANKVGRVILWTLATKAPRERLDGAGGQVTSIIFSPNGLGVAAAVAGRRTVPVWNLSAALSGGPVNRGAASAMPSARPTAHSGPTPRTGSALTAHGAPRPTGPPAHAPR